MHERNTGIWIFSVHVFALAGFALAQPIYSWISRQPEFLVAHGLDLPMALFLTLLLSGLVPAAIAAGVLLFRVFGQPTEGFARAVAVGGLAGILALYLTSSLDLQLALSLAMLAAGLSSFAYHRWRLTHELLTLSGVAAIAFPLLFLLTDPVRTMAFSSVPVVDPKFRQTRDAPPLDIVVIVLDDLPVVSLLNVDGGIDERAFPNFARLAAKSTWYPYATTPHGATRYAFPSIVTGRLPSPESELPQWHHYPENLFLWAAREYGKAVVIREPLTRLCPPTLCPRQASLRLVSLSTLAADVAVLWGHALLPRTVASNWLPGIADRWHNFLDLDWEERFGGLPFEAVLTDRPGQWRRFLAELDHGFHFSHLYLPHRPFWHLPQGQLYYLDSLGRGGGGDLWDTPWLHVVEYQRHLAQLQFTDRLLGELLDRMEAAELWDSSLVIVTADHGTSFRFETRARQMTPGTLGDILNIPLFVKSPGQLAGRVDGFPASLVDIAPTTADAVDRPLDWQVDGVSLLDPDRPPRERIGIFCPIGVAVAGCSSDLFERADEAQIVQVDSAEVRRAHMPDWKKATVFYSERFAFFLPQHRYASLLGDPVEQHHVRRDDVDMVELFRPSRFRDISFEDDHLPALVDGRVELAGSREEVVLAVALNGVIAGLTEPVHWRGVDGFFAALVPPALLEPGRNEVEIYEIVSGDGERDPVLIRLRHSKEATAGTR